MSKSQGSSGGLPVTAVLSTGVGIFVPKPTRGVDCQRCGVADLGTAGRQHPLALTRGGGGATCSCPDQDRTQYHATNSVQINEATGITMSASTSALIIAIVGVIGTLAASIVSQVLSARARRQELGVQRLQRQDEYDREERQRVLANKRSCYITNISATRRYRIELMSYLYAINRQAIDKDATERLEEARLAFNSNLAETVLTGTLSVIEAVEPIRIGLAESYTATKDLERETPKSNSKFEEIRAQLFKFWDEWPRLYTTMRNDLGVED